MSEKIYTLEQIKKAFWSEFHEAGEVWFDYFGSHEENEGCTESAWEDFVEALDKICPTQRAGDTATPTQTGKRGIIK